MDHPPSLGARLWEGPCGTHKLFKMTASLKSVTLSLGTLGLASGPSGVYNPALKWTGESSVRDLDQPCGYDAVNYPVTRIFVLCYLVISITNSERSCVHPALDGS